MILRDIIKVLLCFRYTSKLGEDNPENNRFTLPTGVHRFALPSDFDSIKLIKLNLMGPLIMLYHIYLFEYTSSQFCSRFTLLLELEWPSSWNSKTGVLCEKNLLPTCAFGPSCDEYLSRCPLPLAPFPYTSLAPLYLTLTHFEQEATGHHAKP